MNAEKLARFIHPELDQPVEFFGGSYRLTEEGILPFCGKAVLYFVGVAGLDSSCCGRGGCAFIKIPGFVLSRERKKDESGRLISEVFPVAPGEDRERISKILQERYPEVSQIDFL